MFIEFRSNAVEKKWPNADTLFEQVYNLAPSLEIHEQHESYA